MARFTVKAVDKESGYDTEIVIHADSAANARVKAGLKGIVVTPVEADASDHLAVSAAGHRRGSRAKVIWEMPD